MQLSKPMVSSMLPCGNIRPAYGITGTPIIDGNTGTMYVAGMSTPDGGKTVQQLIWAVSARTGTVRSGWPVDVASVLKAKYKVQFNAQFQNQRGALAILQGKVYVPYGGLAGDCGDYRGYVIGVALSNPKDVTYYRTSGKKGGIWTPGGVSHDSKSLFVSTGNTAGATYWQEGNAVLRLQAGTSGPKFRNVSADFFTPAQWKQYDIDDIDLCGTHPVVLDYPKGNALLGQFGKDGIGYLMYRNDLRGHKGPIFSKQLADSVIISAPAVYRTARGTYIVFKGSGLRCPSGSGDIMAVKLKNTSPPSFDVAWCATQGGSGSPMAVTNGSGKAVVFSAGSDTASNQLHAFDGDTGKQLWVSPALGAVARFHTPIVAKGKVYIASSSGLSAFYIGGYTAWAS